MGTRERRERQRAALRAAILQAAREILSEEGPQAISIRKVAERIEYSPPMIYECFANKEALLMEIAQGGLKTLSAAFGRVAASYSDPVERLEVMLDTYWTFAWAEPELFQTIQGQTGIRFGLPGEPPEVEPIFTLIRDTVADVIGPTVPPEFVADQVHILWITVSSLILMAMAGRIDGGSERARRLVVQAVQNCRAGWLALRP